MPEWTAERRGKIYEALGQGDLAAARVLAEPFKLLKLNDLKPVDKEAFARLEELVRTQPDLQTDLIQFLLGDRPLRQLGLTCFNNFKAFPGRMLVEKFTNYTGELAQTLQAEQVQMVEAFCLNLKGSDLPPDKRDRFIEDFKQSMLGEEGEGIFSIPRDARVGVAALIQVMVRFPSSEAYEALKHAPGRVWQYGLANDFRKALDKIKKTLDKAKDGEIAASPGVKEQVQPRKAKSKDSILNLMIAGDLEGVERLVQDKKKAPALKLDPDSLQAVRARLAAVPQLQRDLVARMAAEQEPFAGVAFQWLETVQSPPWELLKKDLNHLLDRGAVKWGNTENVPKPMLKHLERIFSLLAADPRAGWLQPLIEVAQTIRHDYLIPKYLGSAMFRQLGFKEALAEVELMITQSPTDLTELRLLSREVFLDELHGQIRKTAIKADPYQLNAQPRHRSVCSSLDRQLEQYVSHLVYTGHLYTFLKMRDLGRLIEYESCRNREDFHRLYLKKCHYTTRIELEKNDTENISWSNVVSEIQKVAVIFNTPDMIEAEYAPEYLPLLKRDLMRIVEFRGNKECDLRKKAGYLFAAYCLLAAEPEPWFVELLRRMTDACAMDGCPRESFLRNDFLTDWLEGLDLVPFVRAWWGPLILETMSVSELDASFGWATLYRIGQSTGSDLLGDLFDRVEMRGGSRSSQEIVRWMNGGNNWRLHRRWGKLFYIRHRGIDGFELFYDDKDLLQMRMLLLREFDMDSNKFLRKMFEHERNDGGIPAFYDPELFGAYMRDDVCGPEMAGMVAMEMETGDPESHDQCFRLMCRHAVRFAELGHDIVALTAAGLWQTKTRDAKTAIDRLCALGRKNFCPPAEAAQAIEAAFDVEEPTLWRAAVNAIKSLKSIDPAIAIQNRERTEELIARDPAKYQKLFKPLL